MNFGAEVDPNLNRNDLPILMHPNTIIRIRRRKRLGPSHHMGNSGNSANRSFKRGVPNPDYMFSV